MPMSGSNYVAPTWVNGGPPALDAAELQAMCDTIQENQGDVTALQTALQALTATVNGKAKVITGTYVGTGTNTVTISGLGVPKYLFVCSSNASRSGFIPCLINIDSQGVGAALVTSGGNMSSYETYTVSVNGSTVSISAFSGYSNGLNTNSSVYYYLAFSL